MFRRYRPNMYSNCVLINGILINYFSLYINYTYRILNCAFKRLPSSLSNFGCFKNQHKRRKLLKFHHWVAKQVIFLTAFDHLPLGWSFWTTTQKKTRNSIIRVPQAYFSLSYFQWLFFTFLKKQKKKKELCISNLAFWPCRTCLNNRI